MAEQRSREDKRTEETVREGAKMQRAFGKEAAHASLRMRAVPDKVARRVLENVGQRHQY